MEYYTYILETVGKNNKKLFYTGYSNNMEKRIKEHRKGTGAKFCKGKNSITLKCYEIYPKRVEAMRRETEIKSFTRKQKRILIKEFEEKVNKNYKLLEMVKNINCVNF